MCDQILSFSRRPTLKRSAFQSLWCLTIFWWLQIGNTNVSKDVLIQDPEGKEEILKSVSNIIDLKMELSKGLLKLLSDGLEI